MVKHSVKKNAFLKSAWNEHTREVFYIALNLTYIHSLQHSLYEHLFNIYYNLQHLC